MVADESNHRPPDYVCDVSVSAWVAWLASSAMTNSVSSSYAVGKSVYDPADDSAVVLVSLLTPNF